MIVTVTPNPALDLTYLLDGAPGDGVDVNRAGASTLEASGKGVNVSRALVNAGFATRAVLPAGGPSGGALVDLLDRDGVARHVTRQAGDTRINTTVVWSGGETLKVNGPGSLLSDDERRDVLQATARALDGATWLAVCGSLPPGVGPDLVGDLVDLAHQSGVRCAVDASGAALSAAVEAGADLLAPNQFELSEIDGSFAADGSVADLAVAAASLSRRVGSALLISMGPLGALHVDGRSAIHGHGPPLTPVNTAGAGDALLAGWLSGEGEPRTRLARAITWSRSACLRDTTVDPHPGSGDTATIEVANVDV